MILFIVEFLGFSEVTNDVSGDNRGEGKFEKDRDVKEEEHNQRKEKGLQETSWKTRRSKESFRSISFCFLGTRDNRGFFFCETS